MRARVAEDGERAALWEAMSDLCSGFDEYRERTDRELLIFVLTPSVRSGAAILRRATHPAPKRRTLADNQIRPSGISQTTR
jgi:hypothetical protein